jgi:hypothetical protein
MWENVPFVKMKALEEKEQVRRKISKTDALHLPNVRCRMSMALASLLLALAVIGKDCQTFDVGTLYTLKKYSVLMFTHPQYLPC